MTERWEYGGDAEGGDAPDARPGGAGPVAPAGDSVERFPWPPADGDGILAAFGDTWKSATFDPGRFFARIPREGGTGAALLYYLALGLLVAGATLFWDVLGEMASQGQRETLASELGLESVAPLTGFLLSPLVLAVALFVSAAVVHALLALLDGARQSFGTTVRVFAYAYSPMLFGVIPLLGTLVGSIWMLVLAVVGLRQAHQTDGWRAAVAVILPFVLMLGLVLLMVLTILAAGAAILG